MKYRNASEIFPDELLREIQKYSSGELVYIPEKEKKKGWGAVSGARVYYEQRNEEIRRRFYVEKQKMQELAEEYGLSVDERIDMEIIIQMRNAVIGGKVCYSN